MARGWESKSVEEQIEAGKNNSAAADKLKFTAEQADRKRRRDVLESAKTNILRQLAATTNPRYRALLKDELQSLESLLAAA